MNEFLVFFLIVSIFAVNAFCMYPSYVSLCSPPPVQHTRLDRNFVCSYRLEYEVISMIFSQSEGVEFDECFCVHEITGGDLLIEVYTYYLVCPQKLRQDGPPLPQHEKNWFFVGKFKFSGTSLRDLPRLDFKPIQKSLIQFVFLEGTTVKFVTGPKIPEFKIIFTTLDQTRAFYGMIYHAVNMSKAVSIATLLIVQLVATNQSPTYASPYLYAFYSH